MNIKYLLLSLYFLYVNSIIDKSIIKIPYIEGRFENISTKNGLINYENKYETVDISWRYPLFLLIYRLEGIKNLNLINITEYKSDCDVKIYGKNNDSIEFIYYWKNENKYTNDVICKLLYKTQYINKNIYAIGNLNNKLYKFYGGLPEDIIKEKQLNKYSFNKNDKVSEVIVGFSNGGNNIYKVNKLVEISTSEFLAVCIPNEPSIFKDYEKIKYLDVIHASFIYKLSDKQQRDFANIFFKIGNKTINLDKDKLLFNTSDGYYLYINYNCQNFVFGKKFLNLIDFKEFDLETGELNLYVDKRKDIIKEDIENKKVLLNSGFNKIYLIIIFFSFIIFLMSITVVKNYHKKKKIEYYNNYYNI